MRISTCLLLAAAALAGSACVSDLPRPGDEQACASSSECGWGVCRDGACAAVGCGAGQPCAPGESCVEGTCAAAAGCAAGCPLGKVCRASACVEVACSPPSPCLDGEACSRGVCVTGDDPCPADKICPGGQVCRPGPELCRPVPCAGEGACAPGEACRDGFCQLLLVCEPPRADCNLQSGDGCEADLNSLSDCGGCGRACAPAHGAGICEAGQCRVATCEALWGDCRNGASDGCETRLDTLTDCRACGVPCAPRNANASCANGVCENTGCIAPFGDCDGLPLNGCETSLATLDNCGGCGNSCRPGHAQAACLNGQCRYSACDPLWGDCDGKSDNGCERALNTASDCGACGKACAFDHAAGTCSAGSCALGACGAGYGNCDGKPENGCERALNTLTDCGGCGKPCAPDHAAGTCASGTCAIASCAAGWSDCDGKPENGCERALNTLTDCGGCGKACAPDHAAGTCATGSCAIASCAAGHGNCDGKLENGCERPLTTLADCGSCGTLCAPPHATGTCAAGSCAIASCAAGFGDCDGRPENGCERALNTLADCGGCGKACAPAQGTGTCATGSCAIASCAAGYGNCDGKLENGCEKALNTLSDCGGCGKACAPEHATGTCAAGSCAIASCAAGWGDCDGKPENGCERALNTLTDCGSCGTACAPAAGTGTCASGTCAIASCTPGYGDCDGKASTGCEQALNTLSDCGSCGTACARDHAAASCATGSCVLGACASGWGNCDGQAANGCERPLNTVSDCLGCGAVCGSAHATPSCTATGCLITCDASFGNCNGLAPDGCEADLRNTPDHCGGCGVGCPAYCLASACSDFLLVTNANWKRLASAAAPVGWNLATYDDSGWTAAVNQGPISSDPWRLATGFPATTPARWIWHYDSRTGDDKDTVYFRRTFLAQRSQATLYITADNAYDVYLNGALVGSGDTWSVPKAFLLNLVPRQSYVIAVKVVNLGGPGGLIADLR